MEHTDEHGVIKVRINGNEVDGVVLTSNWRNHYDAQAMCDALSHLIKQSLPELPAATEAPLPDELPSGPMEPARWRAFSEELNAYLDASVRLRERAVAGQLADWRPPTEAVDDRQRVGVDYIDGRFESIAVDPQWAETASLQDLSNRITDALRQHDLVTDRPTDPDREAMRVHGANFMRYLAGH